VQYFTGALAVGLFTDVATVTAGQRIIITDIVVTGGTSTSSFQACAAVGSATATDVVVCTQGTPTYAVSYSTGLQFNANETIRVKNVGSLSASVGLSGYITPE
jgi:adenine/guanine phosphoribosyltransferase-like PRPP-binding protein